MIKTTRKETEAIRHAWSDLEVLCSLAHANGASQRVVHMHEEALKLAKSDNPEAAPRMDCSRASVLGAVLRGIREPGVRMANVATCTHWYLLGVALGAGLGDVISTDQWCSFERSAERGIKAYTTARDRWLKEVTAS